MFQAGGGLSLRYRNCSTPARLLYSLLDLASSLEVDASSLGLNEQSDQAQALINLLLYASNSTEAPRIPRCLRLRDAKSNLFEAITEPASCAMALTRTATSALTAFGDMFAAAMQQGETFDVVVSPLAALKTVTALRNALTKVQDLSTARPTLYQLVASTGLVNALMETTRAQLAGATGGVSVMSGHRAQAGATLKQGCAWANGLATAASAAVARLPELSWVEKPATYILEVFDEGERLINLLRDAPQLIEQKKQEVFAVLMGMVDQILAGPLDFLNEGLNNITLWGESAVARNHDYYMITT